MHRKKERKQKHICNCLGHNTKWPGEEIVDGMSLSSQRITNPVLIVDDLDDAAMLVLHWGRGHWLLWLYWLCCFLLQLLLRNNGNTKHFDQ